MKRYGYRMFVWYSVAISILLLVGTVLGDNGSPARNSGFAKKTASTPAEELIDNKNQSFPIIKEVSIIDEQKGEDASGSAVEVVNDGGFEMGTGSGAWNEFSSNFGTPLCDVPSCGTGGGTGPHTGGGWCWFGGTTLAETGSVDQDVTIPSGTATLSFFLEIPVGETQGFMKVIIDSDTLMTVTEADTQTYATYSQVNMDVSAYADGSTHNLKFFSITNPGSDVTNFFVDDVSIDVVTGIEDPITNTATDFGLRQNYPNPFNPLTTIAYQLASNDNVVLKIYNLTGQEIKTLVNERQSAGLQQVVWDGKDDSGQEVASGIYLYRLRAGYLIQTKEMTLLR